MYLGLDNFKFKNRNTPSRNSSMKKQNENESNYNLNLNRCINTSQNFKIDQKSQKFPQMQIENQIRNKRPESSCTLDKSKKHSSKIDVCKQRPSSAFKRNPITGENIEKEKSIQKKKISSIRELQENSDFSNIHIKRRQEGVFNDRNRKKTEIWKPCVKLVQSYFDNKKNDDFNLKRGLKKILIPYYNRNPILLNIENCPPEVNKHNFITFKPSTILLKLNEKEVFDLKDHQLRAETKNYKLLTDYGFFKLNKN